MEEAAVKIMHVRPEKSTIGGLLAGDALAHLGCE